MQLISKSFGYAIARPLGMQLKASLIKDLDFYCMLLTFLVNMLGFFL